MTAIAQLTRLRVLKLSECELISDQGRSRQDRRHDRLPAAAASDHMSARAACAYRRVTWRHLHAGLVAAAALTRLTRLQCRLDHTLSAARSDAGWTQLLGALPELRHLHMSFDQVRVLLRHE